nr:retrovirus-related Pol polyprotein from transposon TNT 1-94 [Tanacetum cinerariifolium]
MWIVDHGLRPRYMLASLDGTARGYRMTTKDETSEVIKNFLKKICVRLQAPVIIVRTDNGTEFKNQVLKEYFDSFGITHETSAAKTPQQNGVVKRRNRTLVEAARTMLIFSHAPLFLWAEAIATACYTQNRSIIHRRFNKTPYELIQGRKPDISYLHVFGALYYSKNDREDIGKLGAKGDIGFFIRYSANSVSYRMYNRRTRKIIKTMNVTFDELLAMNLQAPTVSMSFQDSAPVPTNSLNTPVSSHNADATSQQHAQQQRNLTPSPTASAADNVLNAGFEGELFINPFGTPSTESVVSSTQYMDPSNVNISGPSGELDGTPTLSDGGDMTKTVKTNLVCTQNLLGSLYDLKWKIYFIRGYWIFTWVKGKTYDDHVILWMKP